MKRKEFHPFDTLVDECDGSQGVMSVIFHGSSPIAMVAGKSGIVKALVSLVSRYGRAGEHDEPL
jgi:hypothetical protein